VRAPDQAVGYHAGMPLEAGTKVDRFRLLEQLGEGGQGSVWRAEDPLDPARRVALKVVPMTGAASAHLERVRREARALARLSHPSLVKCHGLFEDLSTETLGLVIDLVSGRSLADALDDAGFDRALRCSVLTHVARALAYLHGEAVVHRDLKLDNILIDNAFWSRPDDAGSVKLVDFGIAATIGNPNRLTAVGHIVGTPAYMAPELLDPKHFGAGPVTPAADVFAFGVVGWALLIGGHPTGLPPESSVVDYAVEYRRAVVEQPPWSTRSSPDAWGALLLQCLAPAQANRIPDGKTLVSHCQVASYGGPAAKPVPPTITDQPGAATTTSGVALSGSTLQSAPRQDTMPLGGPPPVFLQPSARETATLAQRSWLMPAVIAAVAAVALLGLGALGITLTTASTTAAPSGAPAPPPPVQPTVPTPPSPKIPDGEFAGGWNPAHSRWLPPFKFGMPNRAAGANLIEARASCAGTSMDLCSDEQWDAACRTDSSVGAAESWTVSFASGFEWVVRGGGGCSSRAQAHPTQVAPKRTGLCCDRAASMASTQPQVPVLRSGHTYAQLVESASNSHESTRILALVADPTWAYHKSQTHAELKRGMEYWLKEFPAQDVRFTRCDVEIDGTAGHFECDGVGQRTKRDSSQVQLGVYRERYEWRGEGQKYVVWGKVVREIKRWTAASDPGVE